jgi:hypothetical protein
MQECMNNLQHKLAFHNMQTNNLLVILPAGSWLHNIPTTAANYALCGPPWTVQHSPAPLYVENPRCITIQYHMVTLLYAAHLNCAACGSLLHPPSNLIPLIFLVLQHAKMMLASFAAKTAYIQRFTVNMWFDHT